MGGRIGRSGRGGDGARGERLQGNSLDFSIETNRSGATYRYVSKAKGK